MGAHFNVLKDIYYKADEDIQFLMLSCFSTALQPRNVDLTGIEEDEHDDTLTALRKREARRKACEQAFTRDISWDDIEKLFWQHLGRGLSEAFLASSLLHTANDDFAYLVKDSLETFLDRNAQTLAAIDRKIKEAHPEDKYRYRQMKTTLEEVPVEAPKTFADNENQFRRWRELAQERLAMPRIHGAWSDCIQEDSKDSSFFRDLR